MAKFGNCGVASKGEEKINGFLGKDYVVMASVGHVRDLPQKKSAWMLRTISSLNMWRQRAAKKFSAN